MPRPSEAVRLAVAQQARREAIYDARTARGERMPAPTPRAKLPSLEELTGPEAPKARWRLVLAGVAALTAVAEVARQVAGLFRH